MSATGFHAEPSAKAPWTRTIVLTAAYAGDDAAKAALVRRARIKSFMLHSANVGDSQSDQRSPCIRLDTMFTVSASTVKLKKNEATPCTVVSLRIVLLVI